MTRVALDYFKSRVGSVPPEALKEEIQQWCLNEWLLTRRGSIEAATGVGKSRVAVLAMKLYFQAYPEGCVYICVPTETLRDVEWPAELKRWWPEAPLGNIRIVCHVSMENVRENQYIGLCIFDEIHHITNSNSSFFLNNRVESVMGLSATVPKDSGYMQDSDKLGLINFYAPVIVRISITEAKALKLITDFEIILLKFKLNTKDLNVSYTSGKTVVKTTEAARYKQLSKTLGKSMYSKHKNWKFQAMQQRADFVRNFPTKTKIAKDVLKALLTEDKRTLVFCGSIEQSVELCGNNVYNSKTTDAKLKEFAAKRINYLGAVMALNEGKNIPDLDQIFIVQISSQQRDLVQRIGRTVRWREGHSAKVIILIAKDTVDEKWADKALEGIDKSIVRTHLIKSNDES